MCVCIYIYDYICRYMYIYIYKYAFKHHLANCLLWIVGLEFEVHQFSLEDNSQMPRILKPATETALQDPQMKVLRGHEQSKRLGKPRNLAISHPKTNKHWLIPIDVKRSRPLMTPWSRPPWCPPSATPRRDVFDRGQKQSHLYTFTYI